MRRTNMKCTAITVLILIGALSSGCATTTKSSTTLGISQTPASATWIRYGYVAYVHETIQRTDGNPAGGAVVGALLGAFLGGRGPAAIFGAAGGALSRSSEVVRSCSAEGSQGRSRESHRDFG